MNQHIGGWGNLAGASFVAARMHSERARAASQALALLGIPACPGRLPRVFPQGLPEREARGDENGAAQTRHHHRSARRAGPYGPVRENHRHLTNLGEANLSPRAVNGGFKFSSRGSRHESVGRRHHVNGPASERFSNSFAAVSRLPRCFGHMLRRLLQRRSTFAPIRICATRTRAGSPQTKAGFACPG